MLTRARLTLSAEMLDEAKAFLRIEQDEDDAPLGALMLAAIGHCETFTGIVLLEREMVETFPINGTWQRLVASPVTSIGTVTGIPAEGTTTVIPITAYSTDIDRYSDGWLRVTERGTARRVEIHYRAGMAADWDVLPEAIRMAVLRLSAHFYACRDDPDDGGLPMAVAALLRPWVRVRLS